jgi:hypothetical protein
MSELKLEAAGDKERKSLMHLQKPHQRSGRKATVFNNKFRFRTLGFMIYLQCPFMSSLSVFCSKAKCIQSLPGMLSCFHRTLFSASQKVCTGDQLIKGS